MSYYIIILMIFINYSFSYQENLNYFETPYHVAIFADGTKFCSGALISTTFVITAARCVVCSSGYEILVVAGNRLLISHTPTEESLIANMIIIDPSNILALIKLPTLLKSNDNIHHVAIPAPCSHLGHGQHITSGWTGIVAGTQKLIEPLQSKEIEDFADDCPTLQPYYYCTKMSNEGQNIEDYGSPLVTDSITLNGIVVDASDSYIYYAKIADFANWIKEASDVIRPSIDCRIKSIFTKTKQ